MTHKDPEPRRAPIPQEPPTLYAWDVRSGGTSPGGVTSDRTAAIGCVHQELRHCESGARGKVRKVALAPDGSTRYVDLSVVAEAWLDEKSGALVWVDR